MPRKPSVAKKDKTEPLKKLVIKPPRFGLARFHCVGRTNLVMSAWSQKAQAEMERRLTEASTRGTKGGALPPRNFEEEYLASMHHGPKKGQWGIPCAAFRAASISACRMAAFKMTHARLSIFCEEDFKDSRDGVGLVTLSGEPRMFVTQVRQQQSVTLRSRGQWTEWETFPVIRWDLGQFGLEDVANLMTIVGLQVGLLEGRPDSRSSAGQGWGLFDIKSVDLLKEDR